MRKGEERPGVRDSTLGDIAMRRACAPQGWSRGASVASTAEEDSRNGTTNNSLPTVSMCPMLVT